jgi:hypothetical protein
VVQRAHSFQRGHAPCLDGGLVLDGKVGAPRLGRLLHGVVVGTVHPGTVYVQKGADEKRVAHARMREGVRRAGGQTLLVLLACALEGERRGRIDKEKLLRVWGASDEEGSAVKRRGTRRTLLFWCPDVRRLLAMVVRQSTAIRLEFAAGLLLLGQSLHACHVGSTLEVLRRAGKGGKRPEDLRP